MSDVTFSCQSSCMNNLEVFAKNDKHSIVVDGPIGSGKTHMAKVYAKLLGIHDVVVVNPKVSDVKEAFTEFSKVDNRVLIVVENLDTGVSSCSYVLLKFMEEPSDNLYVVVTCVDRNNIPDTILSRSMTTSTNVPTKSDIVKYADVFYKDKYTLLKNSVLWRTVRTFSDVTEVCSLSQDKISYFSEWNTLKPFNAPVSNVSWTLGHYPDGSEITSNVLVRYILECNKHNSHVVNCCRKCMDQLNLKRIARYLTLTKLAFDLKYCE